MRAVAQDGLGGPAKACCLKTKMSMLHTKCFRRYTQRDYTYHEAATLCSACYLDGGVYCDEACHLEPWRSATDPHKACCHKTTIS